MYFFYKTVHAKYNAFTERRKEAKRRVKQAKKSARSTTIFYCGTANTTKRVAYDLAEEVDQFDPVVCNLNGGDILQKLRASKVDQNTDV